MVDRSTIIDNYTAHSATTNTGVISLVAEKSYDIQLQFEEIGGYVN